MLHLGSIGSIPAELRCCRCRPIRQVQPAACATRDRSSCRLRNIGRVSATSELQSSPAELNAGVNGNSSSASLASFEEFLTFEPEEFELEEGAVSSVNRSSPLSADDVFRCPGCTKAECQVSRVALFAHSCSQLAGPVTACLSAQGPQGCAATPWRFDLDGYLREILTARVYDVAVSGTDSS